MTKKTQSLISTINQPPLLTTDFTPISSLETPSTNDETSSLSTISQATNLGNAQGLTVDSKLSISSLAFTVGSFAIAVIAFIIAWKTFFGPYLSKRKEKKDRHEDREKRMQRDEELESRMKKASGIT